MANPKKSEIDKFLSAGSTDPDDRLCLQAAGLWEAFWNIQQQNGLRAIVYSDNVSKSLTHLNTQTWMARAADAKALAQDYRARTHKRARTLLDAIVLQNFTIAQCAMLTNGSATQQAIKETRVEIRSFLRAFAALAKLPGSL